MITTDGNNGMYMPVAPAATSYGNDCMMGGNGLSEIPILAQNTNIIFSRPDLAVSY